MCKALPTGPSSRDAMRQLLNAPSLVSTTGVSLPHAVPAVSSKAVHALAAMDLQFGRSSGMLSPLKLVFVAGRDKTIRAYTSTGSLYLEQSAHTDRIWALGTIWAGFESHAAEMNFA